MYITLKSLINSWTVLTLARTFHMEYTRTKKHTTLTVPSLLSWELSCRTNDHIASHSLKAHHHQLPNVLQLEWSDLTTQKSVPRPWLGIFYINLCKIWTKKWKYMVICMRTIRRSFTQAHMHTSSYKTISNLTSEISPLFHLSLAKIFGWDLIRLTTSISRKLSTSSGNFFLYLLSCITSLLVD